MKTRKVPMRRCIGCMESKPKKELIRIVAVTDSDVILDATGKAQGRGAYLCPSKKCFELAQKKKAISRNLDVNVSEEKMQELSKEFDQYGE